ITNVFLVTGTMTVTNGAALFFDQGTNDIQVPSTGRITGQGTLVSVLRISQIDGRIDISTVTMGSSSRNASIVAGRYDAWSMQWNVGLSTTMVMLPGTYDLRGNVEFSVNGANALTIDDA